MVLQENQGHKALREKEEIQERKALLGSLAKLEIQDKEEIKVHQVCLGLLEPQETEDQWESQVQEDNRGMLALLEKWVWRDLLALKENLECRENQARREMLDLLGRLENQATKV